MKKELNCELESQATTLTIREVVIIYYRFYVLNNVIGKPVIFEDKVYDETDCYL